MPDTPIAAAPQPAPTAQLGGDVKNDGPANVSEAQFARRFMNQAKAEPAAQSQEAAKAETQPPADNKEEANASPDQKAEVEVKPEAEANSEAETEADEALSKSNSLTPEQQAVVDKRIGKSVAKQRKAERDLAEVKLQLAELSSRQSQPEQKQEAEALSIVPLPDGVSPLANIDTMQGLVKLESEAKQAIRFAEDAIESIRDGDQPPEGWTKQTLREVLRNAKVTLEDQIPNRRQFLSSRQQMQQKAYEVLPFMRGEDKSNSDYKAAQAIYQRHPFLRNIPEGDFTVGLIVEGIKAVDARNAAAKSSATSATTGKAPVISRPRPSGDQSMVSENGGSVRTAPGANKERAMAQERENLAGKKGVSQGDYAAYLSRQSKLRNS